jgi:RND family efflux transporter MFP subunit
MTRRLALLAGAVLAGAALGGSAPACSRPAPEQRAGAADVEAVIPVGAQPARLGNLRAIIQATGLVTPAAGAEFIVTAPEPARIVEMPRAEGDLVASGELLVRFEIAGATADLARQRAEVARTTAQFENARAAHMRARELLDRGIVSRREMENADRDLADAQSAVAQAQASQDAVDAALARATVRAPFDGLVADRLHEPGDLVSGTAADPVLRLIDPASLEVTASIPGADAPRVLQGATALLVSPAVTPPVRLRVEAVLAERGPDGDRVRVRLVFDEPATVAVDTAVEIDIDGEERVDVVLVPAEAIVRQGEEQAVFVAVGARAERRVIATGLEDAERVEIVSGVRAGELVITRGQANLEDGATISVAP